MKSDGVIQILERDSRAAHAPGPVAQAIKAVVRVVLMTIAGALLVGAVGLLLGIVGTALVSAIRHRPADMSLAYKWIAEPAAILGAIVGFAVTLGLEARDRTSR